MATAEVTVEVEAVEVAAADPGGEAATELAAEEAAEAEVASEAEPVA